ncbi:MAG: hypothetical protein KF795_06365 [Labilithrix sp.]|nr:hypothetical protein [Labilithrix sp.]
MRRFSSWLVVLVVLVFVSLAIAPRTAAACAVCGAADKTLPARGEELPFAGRIRATLDGRAAAFAARYAPLRVVELRLVPGAALALSEEVLVSVDLPLLRRSLATGIEGAEVLSADRLMLGDAEARASYVAYRTSSRRLSFHGGAKAPTSPIERDAAGRLVPTDLQPGCGSIVPVVGATYTITGPLLTFWTSASFLMPVSVRDGPHPGDSLRASATAQLQPHPKFATRASVHGRLDSAGDVDDQVDPRSGGASVFLAPELVASPLADLVVSVGAAFPVVQETRGHRVTAPIALVGIGLDF